MLEKQNKKSLKWLWIALIVVVVGAIAVWCGYNASKSENGVDSVFGISALLFGIFIITALGYLLGRIDIKGVSLGTAGVFLVAIAFGVLCTYIPKDLPILGALHLDGASTITKYYKSAISNIGLVLFVGSVGFIAGPKFFRDLKKNFKSYGNGCCRGLSPRFPYPRTN